MNQILATNNEGNNKREKTVKQEKQFKTDAFDLNSLNTYADDPISKKSGNGPIDTKKIIIIFAIAIIIFGIILVGVFIAKTYKEKNSVATVAKKPEILIEENGDKADVSISSEIGLNKVTYYWNENDIQEANGNSTKIYEKAIDIPNGSNTLYVKAIDNNGQITEANKQFTRDGDGSEPVISTSAVGTGQIKITSTDDTSMAYIIYNWEDGEETRIDVKNEGDITIETTIDVKRGDNTLYIKAVDTSGNEAHEEKICQGVLKPTIYVTKKGTKLYMKVSHDKGLKKIEYSINGQQFVYDENAADYDATKTNVEYTFSLKEGENVVGIIATSLEQSADGEYTKETYVGKCNYTPNAQ